MQKQQGHMAPPPPSEEPPVPGPAPTQPPLVELPPPQERVHHGVSIKVCQNTFKYNNVLICMSFLIPSVGYAL